MKPWGGDRDLARQAVEAWRSRGFKGTPSSPAAFWHREAEEAGIGRRRIPWSYHVALQGYFHGGWQAALTLGHVPGPLAYYDLRQAYRWAGSLPLPGRLSYYRKGDARFVAIMDIRDRAGFVPQYFTEGLAIVTHEDVEAYQLRGPILAGVSWSDEDNRAAKVFDRLDYLPQRIQKMAARSYWGRWAMVEGVECQVWKAGQCVKRWKLPPRETDLAAATVIVHRVIRRVWSQALTQTHLIATDAILCKKHIPQGDEPGDWRLEKWIGDGGVFILGPNRWGEVPLNANVSEWVKTAGIAKNADCWLDESVARDLRKRKLLAEAELLRIVGRRQVRGEFSVAETRRIQQILRDPKLNPYRSGRRL